MAFESVSSQIYRNNIKCARTKVILAHSLGKLPLILKLNS